MLASEVCDIASELLKASRPGGFRKAAETLGQVAGIFAGKWLAVPAKILGHPADGPGDSVKLIRRVTFLLVGVVSCGVRRVPKVFTGGTRHIVDVFFKSISGV